MKTIRIYKISIIHIGKKKYLFRFQAMYQRIKVTKFKYVRNKNIYDGQLLRGSYNKSFIILLYIVNQRVISIRFQLD